MLLLVDKRLSQGPALNGRITNRKSELSNSSSMRRTKGNSSVPSAVSETCRVVRSSNGAPIANSNFWMRLLSAGWDMFSVSAALWKLSSSTMERNALRSKISQLMLILHQYSEHSHFTYQSVCRKVQQTDSLIPTTHEWRRKRKHERSDLYPCVLMRGGTSKGPFFLASDLPTDCNERDHILLSIMGSGHPLQIDGIGGGNPVTSKVAIIGPSSIPEQILTIFSHRFVLISSWSIPHRIAVTCLQPSAPSQLKRD